MHVEVAAGVPVGAVVDLVRLEGLVQRPCGAHHICQKGVALFVGDIYDLADMILISHNAAAGVALLLKEDQIAHTQMADRDTELVQEGASGAVSTIEVFHGDNSFPVC